MQPENERKVLGSSGRTFLILILISLCLIESRRAVSGIGPSKFGVAIVTGAVFCFGA